MLQVRQDIIDAVTWRREGRLSMLAKGLLKLDIDAALLASTGIGILANDASVWPTLESREWARAAATKWRALLAEARVTAPEDCLEHKHARRMTKQAPFRSMQASAFVSRVDVLEKDFLEIDPKPPPSAMYRTLAARVILHGFGRVSDLDGLHAEEVQQMGHSDWDRALLLRALQKASVSALRKRMTWAEGVLAPNDCPAPVDGAKFAESITPLKAVDAWEALSNKLSAIAMAHSASGPAKSVATLMKAKQQGADVLGELDQRALMSRLAFLEPSSIPALCSGIRCWHFFACGILGYPPEATLPPKRSLDVQRFMAMFKIGTTGGNYVYHVRNGCKALNLSSAWFDESVAMQIAGAKKQRHRQLPASITNRALLERENVHALVRYNDTMCLEQNSVLVLASWFFLFRVQSEALLLECGAPEARRSSAGKAFGRVGLGPSVLRAAAATEAQTARQRAQAAVHVFGGGSSVLHCSSYADVPPTVQAWTTPVDNLRVQLPAAAAGATLGCGLREL